MIMTQERKMYSYIFYSSAGEAFELNPQIVLYSSMIYSSLLLITLAATVEALSATILIFLFLLQKFGTSRVSFLFSPIMGLWTLTTPLVGIYSILKHYPGIFKALSPHYIIMYFSKNGKEGWLSLGGTILCITGDFQLLIITKFRIVSKFFFLEVLHL